MSYVETSRMAALLDETLREPVGRPRSLDSSVCMLGFYLNALRKGHQACVLDAARALYLMPEKSKSTFGITNLTLSCLHGRMSRWFNDLADRLQEQATHAEDPPDIFLIAQHITRSSLSTAYRDWPSVAVDGTAFPTFSTMHVAKERVQLDGDAIYDVEGAQFGGEAGPPPWAASEEQYSEKRIRIYGIGPDGRKVYTKDTEARAGYRTADGKHRGEVYIGYEVHPVSPIPILQYTNGVTVAVLGPVPPPLALGFNLTPAGTHRGHATLPILRFLHDHGPLGEVAADRGITLMRGYLPELRRMGIRSVHTLTKTQRAMRPGPMGSFFIDETLLSDATPESLLNLPLPPNRASEEVRAPFEAEFNRRAQYRWRTLSGPDTSGRIRLCCPVCTAQVLRCRRVPPSMRLPRHYPLVVLPDGRRHCCDTKSTTFGPTDYPLWMGQVVPFTTAHTLSYGRRNAVETLNSLLHGLYVDIDENWAEPFGTIKRSLLLSFTLAGVNHYLLSGGAGF